MEKTRQIGGERRSVCSHVERRACSPGAIREEGRVIFSPPQTLPSFSSAQAPIWPCAVSSEKKRSRTKGEGERVAPTAFQKTLPIVSRSPGRSSSEVLIESARPKAPRRRPSIKKVSTPLQPGRRVAQREPAPGQGGCQTAPMLAWNSSRLPTGQEDEFGKSDSSLMCVAECI